MKKFILIAIFGLLAMFVNAQQVTLDCSVPRTRVEVNADYTITNTTAAYTLIYGNQNFPTTQDAVVKLKSGTGTPTVSVALFGQKTADTPFVAIGSAVVWKRTTSDTTIVISNATENRYTNYKITYTGSATGTTTIDKQTFKLYLE